MDNIIEVKEKNENNGDIKIMGLVIPYAIVDFLQSVLFALVICIFVYIVIAMPNQIEGDSMKPNFHNGEIIVTNKITQWFGSTDIGKSLSLDYHRGDVIVFRKPGFNDFIKRIIGMPGDTVALKDGSVYINGKKIIESYLPDGTYTKAGDFIDSEAKTVPPDNYFVMGDNRGDSHDSRYSDIGFISRDWMKGRVVFRYWPLPSLSLIQTPEIKTTN